MRKTMDVQSLEAARNKVREEACHPRVEELRSILNSPTSTAEERTAAQRELSGLRPERLALQKKHGGSLSKAQAALSDARRAARDEADLEAAKELRELSTEQLEKRRQEISAEQRSLKEEKRAIVRLLSERTEDEEIERDAAAMSPRKRAKMHAKLQNIGPGSVSSGEAVGKPNSE